MPRNRVELSIEEDFKQVKEVFDQMGKQSRKIQRRIISGVGVQAKGQVKRNYLKSGLQKRSGALYKGVIRKVIDNGTAVVVEPDLASTNGVRYGYVLAKGAVIKPKKAKALTLNIDGKWIRTHEVRIPSRDWVEPPVLNYLNSPLCDERINYLIERELQKLEKKGYTVMRIDDEN